MSDEAAPSVRHRNLRGASRGAVRIILATLVAIGLIWAAALPSYFGLAPFTEQYLAAFLGLALAGTFRTTYQFTAKYEDCANLVGEIVGRCQHPLIASSGEGVFEGVTGRLDFKDDIEAGNFPYRGHLQ